MLRRQVYGRVAYAELLRAGRIGLWQAVLHFDAERGVAFSIYAVVAIQRQMWQAVVQAQRMAVLFLCAEPVNALRLAEENLWQSQVEAALLEAVRRLPTRPRQVMVAAYGLDSLCKSWAASSQFSRCGASVGHQPGSGALLAQRGVAVVAAAHLLRALATSDGSRQSSLEPHRTY